MASKTPKKANLLDHHSIKHILDESVSEVVTARGYVEDVRLSNVRLLIGAIIIVIALFAQFYKKKFPENKDFLIACIALYPFPTLYFVCLVMVTRHLGKENAVSLHFLILQENADTCRHNCGRIELEFRNCSIESYGRSWLNVFGALYEKGNMIADVLSLTPLHICDLQWTVAADHIHQGEECHSVHLSSCKVHSFHELLQSLTSSVFLDSDRCSCNCCNRNGSGSGRPVARGSFTSTGLVVSSKLPRFSDMYTLTIASADPKSISANEPVHLTKSVTEWFTKDGNLVEGLFWKDVEALIVQYTKEPKKSKNEVVKRFGGRTLKLGNRGLIGREGFKQERSDGHHYHRWYPTLSFSKPNQREGGSAIALTWHRLTLVSGTNRKLTWVKDPTNQCAWI
ncbi:hypothetical protein VNO78_31581 [Psophocarpus tetragonolobus]|uniref:Signal peptidase complex subunit 2 n=1 Tax=Psophocarpus tetragonolobus TaxID=3891 RepID=A0AAN9RYF1_PSOTE